MSRRAAMRHSTYGDQSRAHPDTPQPPLCSNLSFGRQLSCSLRNIRSIPDLIHSQIPLHPPRQLLSPSYSILNKSSDYSGCCGQHGGLCQYCKGGKSPWGEKQRDHHVRPWGLLWPKHLHQEHRQPSSWGKPRQGLLSQRWMCGVFHLALLGALIISSFMINIKQVIFLMEFPNSVCLYFSLHHS